MEQSSLKFSVNLYSAELLPEKLTLSFQKLVAAIVTIPVVAALYSGFCYVEQLKLQSDIDEATSQLQNLTTEQASLKEKLEQHKPASTLLDKLDNSRQRLQLTKRLLSEAGDTEQYQSKSYQALLEDLAQTADGSTWLTHIVVDGQQINLSGETQKAAAVPAWIKRLSQVQSLSGVSFNQFIVNRNDNNLLQFKVSSQVQNAQINERGEAK